MNNNNRIATEPSRIIWLDMAKGLCMLFVLWFHAEKYGNAPLLYSRLVTPFFMQAFFFLSGFSFLKRGNAFSPVGKVINVCRGIWLPYLVFTTLLLPTKILVHGWTLREGIVTIFNGNASWFIYELGIIELLVAGMLLCGQIRSFVWLVMAVILLIIGWFLHSFQYPILNMHFFTSLRYMPFFCFGIVVRAYNEELSLCRCQWFCVSTGLAYLAFLCIERFIISGVEDSSLYGCKEYFGYQLLGCLGTAALVSFCWRCPAIRWICFIGRNTLVFYFLQGMVLTLLTHLHCSVLPGLLDTMILVILSGCILTVLSYVIRLYFPIMLGDRLAVRGFVGAIRRIIVK